jgi:hypothetical protein
MIVKTTKFFSISFEKQSVSSEGDAKFDEMKDGEGKVSIEKVWKQNFSTQTLSYPSGIN